MEQMLRRDHAGALLPFFASLLLCPWIVGCDGPAPAKTSPPGAVTAANAAIIKSLSEPTDMDFIETPLKDVLEALQIRHGIKIALDTEPLMAIGVNADTPITYQAKNLSLNSALGQLLGRLKASYIVDNGRMLITTAEKAKQH